MPSYCQKCILPETRPGVLLDAQGVCAGCRNAATKPNIDWNRRASDFEAVVAHAQRRAPTSYDCVIPISGGKDSYWQVVTCLKHGLTPLCVTYAYPGRTELGSANLARLREVGVDHVELRLNPKVERAFIDKAFRKTGIAGLVSHMAIYAYPVQLAARLDIPLVVYGENSAFEYGSEDDQLMGARVDASWRKRFGVTGGTSADDWVDDDISARALSSLRFPSDTTLEEKDIRVVFLGHYFPWDPENSLAVALQHGFRAREEGARVGHYNYVNIDDDMIGVHHHPKWHKFGITRSWDTLSMEIRNGRMSRDEAIQFLKDRGDETPFADIKAFCEYLGWPTSEYFKVVEGFRDRELWTRKDGRWVIEDFLIPDYDWPADVEAI